MRRMRTRRRNRTVWAIVKSRLDIPR